MYSMKKSFSSNRQRSLRKRNFVIILALFVSYVILSSIFFRDLREQKNDIQYFELKHTRNNNIPTLPSHLTIMDPSVILEPRGFTSIDTAHRQGKFHMGAFIFILNSSLKAKDDPKVLMLKRGKDLVTCPNSWTVVGEHTYRDEMPIETVKRGISEELGSQMLDYVLEHGRLTNLTEYPVYYERDYGPSNQGRIDRQFTYMYLVEMNKDSASKNTNIAKFDDLLQLDDEVVEHQWITLGAFSNLVNEEKEKLFCHHTIISLTQLGLQRINYLKSADK